MDTFADYQFSDVIQDELLMTAYSINQMQPRFYSKYTASFDPARSAVPIRHAAAASGSAPVYFGPTVHKNGEDVTEELVDGSVISSNPTLYAYMYANVAKGETCVRLLSIGAGSEANNLAEELEAVDSDDDEASAPAQFVDDLKKVADTEKTPKKWDHEKISFSSDNLIS